jgi:uncharacterized protein YndB with AHSA1/START domain
MRGSASTEIDAAVERVWQVVSDVESWPQWQAAMGGVEVEARDADGRPELCQVVFDAKVQTLSTVQRVRYEPPLRLSFEQERGSLKTLRGAWRLEDLGGGRTRATYDLEVAVGGVLGRLVSGAVEDRLRDVLVMRLPGELRARAEAP